MTNFVFCLAPRLIPFALKAGIVLGVLAMCVRCAAGMTLERVGAELFATGAIVAGDEAAFQREFEQGGLRRLILVNSSGGSLSTAFRIAFRVRSLRLETLVSGHCLSSCSLIFMAGAQRQFATGHLPRATVIGIHGPSHRDTRELQPGAALPMVAFYRAQMGSRYDTRIFEPPLKGLADHTGMLRMRELQRTAPKDRVPWFCPSVLTPLPLCIRHEGHDALTLGVVTHPDTVTIDLPESMRMPVRIFGVPVPEPEDGTSLSPTDSLLPERCRQDTRCDEGFRAAAERWYAQAPHRALAVPLDGGGYAFAHGADSPWMAALQAVYACNHARSRGRLCRVVALDDRLVPTAASPRFLESPGSAMSQVRLPLAAPVLDTLGPEGPERVSEPRRNMTRGPAPQSLEGVERIDTLALAKRLSGSAPPLLIDVSSESPVMLPGTVTFVNGGRAFEDDAAEAAFDQRFRYLLRAAGASSGREIVFLCSGATSWASVNAALRARKAGYSRVSWYRGGLAAWQQAGLPSVQRTLVAVLH